MLNFHLVQNYKWLGWREEITKPYPVITTSAVETNIWEAQRRIRLVAGCWVIIFENNNNTKLVPKTDLKGKT